MTTYTITIFRTVVVSVNSVNKQPRRVDRRMCGQQTRPSTSCVHNAIDLLGQNFPSLELGIKFQKDVSLFLDFSLQHSVG